MKIERGFTIAELLVVIAITAIVGTIMVAIFTNTLRGSNKSQILANIKQNGQAVLENIDKTVREADNVVCTDRSASEDDTLVVVKNGNYTRYRIIAWGTNNGSIQQDSPLQSEESDITIFLEGICADPMGRYAAPNSIQNLIDNNLQTGVSVQNVPGSNFFTRNPLSGSKDSVTIKFQLGPPIGAPDVVRGQIDPVVFQTTVQLR